MTTVRWRVPRRCPFCRSGRIGRAGTNIPWGRQSWDCWRCTGQWTITARYDLDDPTKYGTRVTTAFVGGVAV